jgi:hypothetical protein
MRRVPEKLRRHHLVENSSSGRKFVVDDDLHRPTPFRIGELTQDQQGGLAGEPLRSDNITDNSG